MALIIGRDLLKISGKRIMKDGGILEKMEFFEDIGEAEKWLDG
jgi:hypothetical protein